MAIVKIPSNTSCDNLPVIAKYVSAALTSIHIAIAIQNVVRFI